MNFEDRNLLNEYLGNNHINNNNNNMNQITENNNYINSTNNNNNKTSNYLNTNSSKLTEVSQLGNNSVDKNQNYLFFSNLDNNLQPSPMITNVSDIQQYENTPIHLGNGNYQQNSDIASLSAANDSNNQKYIYFNNISPISRYQTKINQVANSAYPIVEPSNRQLTNNNNVNNNNNNIRGQQITKIFTPSDNNNFKGIASFAPQTSSFIPNGNLSSNSSSICSSNKQIIQNNPAKNDENFSSLNNQQFIKSLPNNINTHKVQFISQENSSHKQLFQAQQSPEKNNKQEKPQNQSAQQLIAKLKNEDELNYQREMIQTDKYLQKQKHVQNHLTLDPTPPYFGSVLAKHTSPLKNNNTMINIPYNTNSSQNQSTLLQLANSHYLGNHIPNNNLSNMSVQNNNQSGLYFNQTSKSHQNSGQKNNLNSQSQFGLLLNLTNESNTKNKLGITLKEEKSIQESRAYLQAMKALQDRVKQLEQQLLQVNMQDIRSQLESEYLQMIEESNETIKKSNQRNEFLQEQVESLHKEIEIIAMREAKELTEMTNLIESHVQNEIQLNNQLENEINKNQQLQMDLAETQQKWEQLYEENKIVETKRIEQLQSELQEEKSQHLLLKALCLKTTQEMQTLLVQNQAFDNKLQAQENEFKQYRALFNQGQIDQLKDQIAEQKQFLQKIEEQMNLTHQTKLQQLETELSNSKLIEQQLRNELQEIKQNIQYKQGQGVVSQSPQSLKKYQSNQINLNLDNKSPRYYGNQTQQMNQSQRNVRVNHQQIDNSNNNTHNNNEQGQTNSQSELERYLSPSPQTHSFSHQESNKPINHNHNNSNAHHTNNNHNTNYNDPQIMSHQNSLHSNDQNKNIRVENNNYSQNNQNHNQINKNMYNNQQQQQQYQDQNYNNIDQQNNQRGYNYVNEVETYSMQEESDLLNFDYDDLQQQSRLNSKSSPILNNIQHKQDSPLRRRPIPPSNVSSSLQIHKQFQNSSIENGQINQQNQVNSSPFFNNNNQNPNQYDFQHSPNFKTSHTHNFNNQSQQINQQINLKENWSFKDQTPKENYQNQQQDYSNQQQGDNNNYESSQYQNKPNHRQQNNFPSIIQRNEDIQYENNRQMNKYEQQDQQQQYNQSAYLQYSDTINNEQEYRKQALINNNKRSKSSNQSLHKQQQSIRMHKNSVDNHIITSIDDTNLEQNYPSNAIGKELIRDIFEAESELKLLNQRYEVLLAQSRSEDNSKKKSDIRKEVITISEKIKILNEKLYVLKKREKFIMNQQYQKQVQDKQQNQNVNNKSQYSSSQHTQPNNHNGQ